MKINEITEQDFQLFWPVFKQIIQAESSYAFEPSMAIDAAYQLWCLSPDKCFVMKEDQRVLGSYYIKANAAGPGGHIANCGYMVAPESRGKGVARKMCQHSQEVALSLGYRAMQFNAVVSSNTVAIQLWEKLGFTIIGTVPNAYKHKTLGFIDSYIMYKPLI